MSEQTHIAKALGNTVRQKILDELIQGPLTLDDLSTKLKLKTESIYHHVRILQHVGLIEEFEPVRSGSPGRPFITFKLTGQRVIVQYPLRDYLTLSEVLLNGILEMVGLDSFLTKLRSIGHQVGTVLAKELSSMYKVDSWTLEKVKQYFVERYLKETGHQPEVIEFNENILHYITRNCLFFDLVKKYPDSICAIDKGVTESLFASLVPNSKVNIIKCMGPADKCCECIVKLI